MDFTHIYKLQNIQNVVQRGATYIKSSQSDSTINTSTFTKLRKKP